MARVPPFVFLEHTADIKFVVRGKTPAQLFENAALAVSHYLVGGGRVQKKLMTSFVVKGEDYESVLYAFLDELLYLLDAEAFVVARVNVRLDGMNAHVVAFGDDARKYAIHHVKAATYAEMYLKETLKGWEAQAVLDV